MAVIDLRERSYYRKNPVLEGQQAVANIASFMQSEEAIRERRRQQYQEQLLKNSELAVIQTIAQGSAEGWDKRRIHEALMMIPQAVETQTYRQFAMRGAGTGTDYAPTSQIKYWQDIKEKAFETGDKNLENFAQHQIESALIQINPTQKYDTDYYQRTTSQDERLKHKISYAKLEPNKATDSYRDVILKKGGTEKDIEDLRKIFNEGNEQKIAEAIRRIGIY